MFSTYLGGSSNETLSALVLDSHGSIYLTGDTQSNNFPVTANAYQATNHGGPGDAFITKLTPGASTLVFSTYFGGSGVDHAAAFAIDSAGDVYLTGFTQSTDFPLVDAFQKILGIAGAGSCGSTSLMNSPPPVVCADAFVTKFNPSGVPIYSSYLGGENTDAGQAIVVDSLGSAYVAGGTESPNFPVTPGAYQWSYLGGDTFNNVFVVKIGPQDAPSLALSPQQINFGNQALNTPSNPTTVTLTNEGSAALAIQGITAGQGFSQTNTCGTSLAAGGSTCSLQVTFTPTQAGPQTGEVTITDNAAGSPHFITVSGSGILSAGSLSVSPTTLAFPAQAVTTTSSPQTVLIVNNGTLAVTITNIAAAGFFEQTNTCGTLPLVLNVGSSCTVSITFTPTGSGNFTGSLTITSNAANSSSVSLSGTGIPIFNLSANTRSSVLVIGTTSTTFTVSASAPSSFIGSISLACSASGSTSTTCSFSPAAITGGQSSTVTVKGLSASTASPLNVTITGTYINQSASVALTIFLADFALSATPSGATVTAGNNATYTITVTPSNGFSQVVLLSCGNLPQDAVCYFAPPGLTLNGSTFATSVLTITTVTQSGVVRQPPRGGIPPGFRWWALMLATLVLVIGWAAGAGRLARGLRPRLRVVVLLTAIILVALGVACQNYYNPINITPVVNGTPSGNFTIPIIGTLGSDNSVRRATTVNLSVAP